MITYCFNLEDGRTFTFQVDRQRSQKPAIAPAPASAEWTHLGFKQCDHCPLDSQLHPFCPVAVDVEQIATRFADLVSYTRAHVEVQAPERTYYADCDVQTGLRSLLGLVMATSACPILNQMKGMAMSHLPFATLDETIVRTVGAYLIKQYFVDQSGGEPDLKLQGLDNYYQELQILNRCFNSRIAAASHNDANLNAVVSLLCVSAGVNYSLEDHLNEIKGLFSA